jgi:RHS repeat-associated protein
VLIGGQPAARVTDSVSCGGTIVAGENTVLIGGQPAARQGDPTCHGGSITSGCDTVLIGKPLSANSQRPALEQCTCEGDPVNVATGQVYDNVTDIRWPGGITLTRYYATEQQQPFGRLGWGWQSWLEMKLRVTTDSFIWTESTGREIIWPLIPVGQSQLNPTERLILQRQAQIIEITNQNNNLSYTFLLPSPATEGQLIRIASPRGSLYASYTEQFLTHLEDSRGNHYSLNYSPAGLLTTISAAATQQPLYTYHYDPQAHLLAVVNEVGATYRYAYDEHHRLIQKTNRRGYSFYYRYDNRHRCLETQGDEGAFYRAFVYTPQRTEVTDATGHQTVYYHNPIGLVTRTINALGHEHHYDYDSQRHLIKTINELGQTTHYRYDTHGRLRVKIDPAQQRWELDHDGNRMQTRDPTGRCVTQVKNHQQRLIAVYDSQGNHFRGYWAGQLLPPQQDPTILNRKYDNDGRLLSERNGFNETRHYSYDAHGRCLSRTAFNGLITHYTYDAEDHLTQVTNALGEIRRWVYNTFGQQLQQENAAGGTLRYEYNLEGQLTTITNETGETHQFHYDELRRLHHDQDSHGYQRYYTYHAGSQVRVITDSAGREYHYHYHHTGQLQRLIGQASDGSVVEYHYTYDPAGRLLAAENEAALVQLDYDELGRIQTERFGDWQIHSTYDSSGNLARLATTWGLAVSWEYDNHHHLHRVLLPQQREITYHRDPWGRPRERHLPGGVWSHCEHDSLNRLQSQTLYHHDRLWTQRQYHYDPLGRLIRLIEPSEQITEYRYDRSGQLIQWQNSRGEVEQFRYDAAGNPLNSTSDSWRANRVTTWRGEECQYDVAGNLISRGATRYEYDVFNQLVRIKRADGVIIEYQYDALGRRIGKQMGTTRVRYVWNQLQLVGEQVGDTRREYVCYPQSWRLLCSFTAGQAYFYHLDQLGTVREITDEAGQLVWRGRYHAFGEGTAEGNIEQPWRLPGQYFDAESGLHYNVFRYYDPKMRRYLTPDPVSYWGGDVNLYRYAHNDPVNRQDEQGWGAAAPAISTVLCGTGVGCVVVMGMALLGLGLWVYSVSNQAGCQGCVLSESGEEGGASEESGGVEGESSPASPEPEDGESSLDQKAAKKTNKSRNKPPAPLKEAEGRPHSIIEKSGKDGQYTTHNGDGTWKQYRGSGQDHRGIPRPNVKETGKNITPDGRTFIDKGRVRPARPDEIPGES